MHLGKSVFKSSQMGAEGKGSLDALEPWSWPGAGVAGS